MILLKQNASRYTLFSSLTAKLISCIIVFALLLAWGWLTHRQQSLVHHPPIVQELVEHHASQDVTILRAYEWRNLHIFLPREYVKIIRYRIEMSEE